MTIREFHYTDKSGKKHVLPEIDPGMTADDHKAAFAATFPELTNAGVKEVGAKDGKTVYEFTASIGRKG